MGFDERDIGNKSRFKICDSGFMVGKFFEKRVIGRETGE